MPEQPISSGAKRKVPRFWAIKRKLLLALLGEYADALGAQGKRSENAVLDVMDTLVGYCHPECRLDV